MKKTILFLSTLLWSSVYGQTQMDLPVNFDDAGVEYGVIGFGGSENSSLVADPTDASNTVVQVIKSATAETWAGTTVTNAAEQGFSTPIAFDALHNTMTVAVWSPNAGIQVRLKVEDYTDPTKSVETEATVTMANMWETLTFDFSNEASGTAMINYGYSYNKASIFFNFGVNGATAGEQTYYFDDMMMGEAGSSSSGNVTFRVDMSEVTETFTAPEVNGTFNNWCGSCAAMTDVDGDDIWEITISLDPGMYEYKFSYDAWTGQETLLPGSSCTMTTGPFTNRMVQVTGDEVLDVVCWGSCSACGINSGPYPVTFQVDMSQYNGTFVTPEVNGTFNNWCGACAPMTDSNGDNIWEITIPLNPGAYEYKFSYDAWTGQENLTPGSTCTITTDGFTNRQFEVTEATTLTAVCWESCLACPSSVFESTDAQLAIYPNPADELLVLEGRLSNNYVLSVYGINGQMVHRSNLNNGTYHTLSTEQWPNGLYEVLIHSDGATQHYTLMVEH